MRIEHFRYLFNREIDIFYLTENIAICKKPFNIWNKETGESINFKTLDDVLAHKIGDKTVREIIENMEKPFTLTLDGGRGAGSGSGNTFSFSHAGRSGSGAPGTYIPPAVANTRIKSKSLDGALAEFKRNHLLANREFAYSVDENGYVTGYNKGGAHSVAIPSHGKQGRGRTNMIIHNHPSGGAFSDTDLHTMASDRSAKGIIASGKNYDYKITKGTHFKAQAFSIAVSTAKMTGKNYDDAVDKWLTANQKTYGYSYSRTKN